MKTDQDNNYVVGLTSLYFSLQNAAHKSMIIIDRSDVGDSGPEVFLVKFMEVAVVDMDLAFDESFDKFSVHERSESGRLE